jgi:hypothetical protein
MGVKVLLTVLFITKIMITKWKIDPTHSEIHFKVKQMMEGIRGVTWNGLIETGGVVVSDEVWLHCEVQLIKQ